MGSTSKHAGPKVVKLLPPTPHPTSSSSSAPTNAKKSNEEEESSIVLRSPSSTSSQITTATTVLIVGILMYALHSSAQFQEYYHAFYTTVVIPYGGHRMSEPILAVGNFTLAGFFFTIINACGVKKMKAVFPSRKKKSGDVVESQKGFIAALFEGDFGLVVALNVGIYLLVIDISQRFAEGELRHLSLIQTAPLDPPSLLRLIAEVLFSVWAYDFIFYFIHRSFHAAGANAASSIEDSVEETKKIVKSNGISSRLTRWWYTLHLPHHDDYTAGHKPLRPTVTFHHHIIDASAQVGINIVVQQIPLAWAAAAVLYIPYVLAWGAMVLLGGGGLLCGGGNNNVSYSSSSVADLACSALYHQPLLSPVGLVGLCNDEVVVTAAPLHVNSTTTTTLFPSAVGGDGVEEKVLNQAAGGASSTLGGIVALLCLLPTTRHTLSKLMHNIVVTYLLIEAHSGFDLPFQSHRLLPSVFGGAPRHQIHHGTGRRYFHQFFMYLDDFWGPLQA